MAIVSSVRPWNARSKTTTALRPVAARATLTAFSTASAPELTSSDFVSARARPQLGEAAADLHVGLVHADHEALVQIAVGLLVDGSDDARRSMPEVLAGDAAAEVEVLASVGVPDAGAFGPADDERRRRDATRDVAVPRFEHPLPGGAFLHGHGRPDYRLRDAGFQTAPPADCEALAAGECRNAQRAMMGRGVLE